MLGLILHGLARRHVVFFALCLPGTILHELSHWIVGLLTFAKPVGFSVWPRRIAPHTWQLGSVNFVNIQWWNAALVALAPLGIVLAPLVVAVWRVKFQMRSVLDPNAQDIMVWLLMAPVFCSFLPSAQDLKVACRSWPMFMLAGLVWALTHF